jgi:hypothetical protein
MNPLTFYMGLRNGWDFQQLPDKEDDTECPDNDDDDDSGGGGDVQLYVHSETQWETCYLCCFHQQKIVPTCNMASHYMWFQSLSRGDVMAW